MDMKNRTWQCSKCFLVLETTRDFALHLRTHLAGHRSRVLRNEDKKKVKTGDLERNISLEDDDPSIMRFDNVTATQMEICQPSSLLNLMNVHFETREICKHSVDPSLVMPSSKHEVEETSEYNYKDLLNFNKTENSDGINKTQNEKPTNNANKLQMLTKDLLLESPVKEGITPNEAEVNNSIQGATITPLNLYYIDENNCLPSHKADNKILDINTISIDNNSKCLDSEGGGNIIYLDNSVDETVKSMNISKQIVTGAPIQIVSLTSSAYAANNNYVCEICSKKFEKATYLHRHLQTHIGDYSCKYCEKEFARKDTWLAHYCMQMKLAEKQDELKKQCMSKVPNAVVESGVVSNTFDPNSADNTKTTNLEEKKVYRCEICDVTIKDKSGLNRHMLTHTEVCYTCVYCDLTVKHRHSIRRHLQRSHCEYEHEWRNSDFISILQTDKKRERPSQAINKKKKKQRKSKKKEECAQQTLSALTPKKDRLIGTLTDEFRIRIESNPLNKMKGSQISDYLNCETSINSVKDDSSDLLSFAKHFEDDIAHTSFQALTLPDVSFKSFSGSELLKVDSKDSSSLKNFNISPVMLRNYKRGELVVEASPEKSSSVDVEKLHNFFSTPLKDKCVFFESPLKTWNGIKEMPSMPVLFCEEEPIE